jgi:hypothetical protein
MSVVFDGDGYIGGFDANLNGDFDVILPTITMAGTFQYLFGMNGGAGTFLQSRSSELRLRFSDGGATINLPPVASGTVVTDGRITRTGGILTFTFNGETGTSSSTGALRIQRWGASNTGSNFKGSMAGVATIVGDSSGAGAITHDFDGGNVGDTELTNTTGDYEHGTLVGFTTGGFQGTATPTPSVADAGVDQSNISARDVVTLDSSGSTGVVSRQWTEVTSTGVALDDATAESPTFTAPSFTELTEIEFQLTTTGSDTTTDTDNTSVFVLADGAVVTDPTITLDDKTYSYYTRKADINGEAIFPVSGVITDLPAGAVAEYQLDGTGNWNTLATQANGNFSGDIIITNQQNLTVRVSTNTDVTAGAAYLTAGQTWLAWWQSNESGRGSSTQNNVRNELAATDPRPTMFRDGIWQRLADPVSEDSSGGSTWVRIAVEYAKLGIPIGVINVAIGGTSISRWVPSASDLWDTRIIAEVTEADCGGITYTASLGGESDVGKDSATMRAYLDEMINALHTEFGSIHYLTDIPRTYENGTSDTLRAEFDYIIDNSPYCRFGGDLEVIDLTTSGDGTHLNSGAQLNEAGNIRFTAFTAVEIENTAPTVSITGDASLTAGAPGTYTANVNDPDTGDSHTYLWRIVSGDGSLNETQTQSVTLTSTIKTVSNTVRLGCIAHDETAPSEEAFFDVAVAAYVPPVQATQSTLRLKIAGLAIGLRDLTLFDMQTKELLFTGDVLVNKYRVNVPLSPPKGTKVFGWHAGSNPPYTSTGVYGVTE